MTKLLGGVSGRGFMPGQSGNPSGLPRNTPKVAVSLAKLLRLRPEVDYTARNRADEIALELYRIATEGEDDRARLAAIDQICNRLYGRPAQAVEINSDQRTQIVIELGGGYGSDEHNHIEALDGDVAPVALLGK
jgi:DNA-binding Xre family transcriptional regulator